MMQELVGIMEEYIRFVSGFEVAYHNVHTQNDSDSASSICHAQTKNNQRKKNKKKRGIPPPDREVKREFMMLRRSLEGYRDCLVDIKEDIEYTIQMVRYIASQTLKYLLKRRCFRYSVRLKQNRALMLSNKVSWHIIRQVT